jgi:hypothetical protein
MPLMPDPTQTTEGPITQGRLEAAYAAYQMRLGNLTEREESAHRRAFLSGWMARHLIDRPLKGQTP